MKYLLLAIFCVFWINTYGQKSLKITTPDNSELIELLNEIELLSENRERYLTVRIYQAPNAPGSAGTESGEVTHDLFIAVSEHDENPKQNLFRIGSFYSPEFIEWTETVRDRRSFKIGYGGYNNQKQIILSAEIDKLAILE